MQELTTAPQMTSPYTPAGGFNMPALAAAQPKLGTPIPGTAGGLAAKPGLTVYDNPLPQELQSNPQPTNNPQAQQSAQHTQSYGRGEDTMLVHMTPEEVNSLKGLAQQFGGDLTTNPHTGLPEAGWLGKLLPTLLGGLGMAFGIPPIWMGALGAAGGTIATGDLGKGLMMGLQAYGGASLGGAAGIGGKLGHVGASIGLPGSTAAVMHPAVTAAAGNVANAAGAAPNVAGQMLGQAATKSLVPTAIGGGAVSGAPNIAAQMLGQAAPAAAGVPTAVTAASLGGGSVPLAAQGATSGFGGFGAAAKAGLPGGIVGKVAPMLAAQGALSGVSSAMTPSSGSSKTSDGLIDNSYQGPYYSEKRTPTFAPSTQDLLSSSKERRYFDISQPAIFNAQGQMVQPGSNTAPGTPILRQTVNPNAKKGQNMYTDTFVPWQGGALTPLEQMQQEQQNDPFAQLRRYADGGEVDMGNGSFVVDARTVSELGNGSSNAGKEILARMGGRPLDGPGDGVSDSIPARIGGHQEARVARDEVIMPPQAVRRIGGGSEKRGTQKLYALMDKAHKARKNAKRGQDTKIAKGLGAL